MQTRVSTKGQVVLPGAVRRRLGIRPGDPLDVNVEGTRIVLTTRSPRKPISKIIEDPLTGLPVLCVEGEGVPVLTSRDVEDMLAEFP